MIEMECAPWFGKKPLFVQVDRNHRNKLKMLWAWDTLTLNEMYLLVQGNGFENSYVDGDRKVVVME